MQDEYADARIVWVAGVGRNNRPPLLVVSQALRPQTFIALVFSLGELLIEPRNIF